MPASPLAAVKGPFIINISIGYGFQLGAFEVLFLADRRVQEREKSPQPIGRLGLRRQADGDRERESDQQSREQLSALFPTDLLRGEEHRRTADDAGPCAL